jgi:uncharacterized membrane protein HdeD (DUF308 family)
MDEESISRSIDAGIRSYRMLGLLLVILGIIGIFFPLVMGGIVTYLISFALILMGGMYLGMGVYGDSHRGMTWAKAIIFLLIGLLIIIYPYEALATVALIMAIFFFAGGLLAIVLVFVVDDGKAMLALNGVFGFILGILLLMGWPDSSEVTVGLFLGIYLLIEGITMISLGSYLQTIREDR